MGLNLPRVGTVSDLICLSLSSLRFGQGLSDFGPGPGQPSFSPDHDLEVLTLSLNSSPGPSFILGPSES